MAALEETLGERQLETAAPPALPIRIWPPDAEHTFESFVVGVSNTEASRAARALVDAASGVAPAVWPVRRRQDAPAPRALPRSRGPGSGSCLPPRGTADGGAHSGLRTRRRRELLARSSRMWRTPPGRRPLARGPAGDAGESRRGPGRLGRGRASPRAHLRSPERNAGAARAHVRALGARRGGTHPPARAGPEPRDPRAHGKRAGGRSGTRVGGTADARVRGKHPPPAGRVDPTARVRTAQGHAPRRVARRVGTARPRAAVQPAAKRRAYPRGHRGGIRRAAASAAWT